MPNLSIFNDVLGPVMVGPSSSHTAGTARLALWARRLLGRRPDRATLTFDPGGSLAYTYRGQRSDRGFTAGLLGLRADDERLKDALDLAAAEGMAVEFRVAPLMNPSHPNDVELRLEAEGALVTVRGASVGGGMFLVTAVDGVEVAFSGDSHILALLYEAGQAAPAAQLQERLEAADCTVLGLQGDGNLLLAQLAGSPPVSLLDELKRMNGVFRVQTVAPILPVPIRPGISPLFRSSAELEAVATEAGISLGEVGLRYEINRSGWSEAETKARMARILQVMEQAAERGLAGGLQLVGGLVSPTAAQVESVRKSGRLLGGHPLSAAVAGAMAVMENSNAMGVVVAAPTAGSCGVIPGVLRGLAMTGLYSHADLLRGLFAAGAAGLIVARSGTFAAEVGGCQAECGVSSAMAAAALIEIAGGGAADALEAAAIALQNTLGLICDPVSCMVEIPCIARNAMAVGNAFAVADMVVGGYRQGFPFDEVVDAMVAVAQAMPPAHRCTGLGGVAATPTARRRTCGQG